MVLLGLPRQGFLRRRISLIKSPSSPARRVGWFLMIWVLSVGALGIIAYAIRWALAPALS
jgi:Protein of unknown function (DUF2474)